MKRWYMQLQKKQDLIENRNIIKKMLLNTNTRPKDRKEAGMLLLRINKALGIMAMEVKMNQLGRIEKMLRWLIVRKKLDYLSHDLEHNDYSEEYRRPIFDEMFKLGEHLPDIGNIFPVKKSGKD